MSSKELEGYAQTGALPDWFKDTAGATEEDNEQRLLVDILAPLPGIRFEERLTTITTRSGRPTCSAARCQSR